MKKVLEQRRFAIPETIDDLLASLENPYIPPEDWLAQEDDDSINFKDKKCASEALGLQMGTVPEWLQQRYKSEFPHKKTTPKKRWHKRSKNKMKPKPNRGRQARMPWQA